MLGRVPISPVYFSGCVANAKKKERNHVVFSYHMHFNKKKIVLSTTISQGSVILKSELLSDIQFTRLLKGKK